MIKFLFIIGFLLLLFVLDCQDLVFSLKIDIWRFFWLPSFFDTSRQFLDTFFRHDLLEFCSTRFFDSFSTRFLDSFSTHFPHIFRHVFSTVFQHVFSTVLRHIFSTVFRHLFSTVFRHVFPVTNFIVY